MFVELRGEAIEVDTDGDLSGICAGIEIEKFVVLFVFVGDVKNIPSLAAHRGRSYSTGFVLGEREEDT